MVLMFNTFNTFGIESEKGKMQKLFSIKRNQALNLHATFLVFFSIYKSKYCLISLVSDRHGG